MSGKSDETYSDAETARRRDVIIKNMIATPPTLHKQKIKASRPSDATRAKAKKRAPSA